MRQQFAQRVGIDRLHQMAGSPLPRIAAGRGPGRSPSGPPAPPRSGRPACAAAGPPRSRPDRACRCPATPPPAGASRRPPGPAGRHGPPGPRGPTGAEHGQAVGRIDVVVHHQDARGRGRRRPLICRRSGQRRWRVSPPARAGGPRTRCPAEARAVGLHRAAVHLHQPPHQRQADAQAALRRGPASGPPGRTGRRRAAACPARCRCRCPARAARPRRPPAPAVRQMRPPGSVYLAALFSRLASTWASRTGSASTHSGSGGSATSSSCWRASMSGRLVSTARATTAATSTGSLRKLDLAAGDARHVQQVVHQAGQVLHLPLHHVARLRHARPASAPASRRICRPLRMGASGLRSSWASIARNSSLRRSASRNSCSSRSRSFSACFRSAISASSSCWRRSASRRGPRLGQLALGAHLLDDPRHGRREVVQIVGRLGHEIADAGRRAWSMVASSLKPVARMAGTSNPAALTRS